MSCRRPDGTSHEDIWLVVIRVAVSTRCAFDVLDAGVVGLDLARGGAGDDEDPALLSPPANSPPEPDRFGLAGFLHQIFELILGRSSVFQRTGAQ